jgi:hypothetical protein
MILNNFIRFIRNLNEIIKVVKQKLATITTLSSASSTSMYKTSSTSLENGLFDNVPHLREAVSNGTKLSKEISLTNTFATHPEGGGIDNYKTYQKYKQGREAADDYYETGISYIFITKPNLNLTSAIDGNKQGTNGTSQKTPLLYNTTENGFVEYIATHFPEIIDSLTYSTNNSNTVPMFIPILYNHCRATSLEDHNFLENTYFETYKGFSQRLPTTAGTSMAGGTITVTYDELDPPIITYLHKLWFDYIEKVKFGYMIPSSDTIAKKELDYTSALYYFSCGPDGETIRFWAKYTGIFPQNVPYSAFDGTIGERNVINGLSCAYMYSYKEFLQPEILQDFNDTFDGGNTHSLETDSSDLKAYTTAVDDLAVGTGTLTNPNNITYNSGFNGIVKRAFSNVGIVKSDADFKLSFY